MKEFHTTYMKIYNMKDNDNNELNLEEKIKNEYDDILYYSSIRSKRFSK